MQALKTWFARKLKDSCGCQSGKTYRACCFTRESLHLIVAVLFILALVFGASFDRSVALLILAGAALSAILLYVSRSRR